MATRVLFIIDYLELGGAEQRLLSLIRGLDREAYQTVVCPLYSILTLEDEFCQVTKVVRPFSGKRVLFGTLWNLYDVIGRFKPDIVHTWLTRSNIYGVLIARAAGVPVVICSNTTVYPESMRPDLLWLQRLSARLADVVVCNTVAGCRQLATFGVFTRFGSRVIPNGIDLDRYRRDDCSDNRRRTLASMRLKENVPVIGSVGRTVRAKSQMDLLHAIRIVLDSGRDIQALIVGDGKLRIALEQEAIKLGLARVVFFAGSRQDVSTMLSVMDLFVLSSVREGLPNAMLEAMACGLPVIATDVGGVSEAVLSGLTGLLVPPHEPGVLASTIQRVLDSPELAQKLGTAARAHILEHYSLSQMVQRMGELYREMLHRASNPGSTESLVTSKGK